MDLPFAHRWYGAARRGSGRHPADHRDAAFGRACGLLIRELRLLSRAVLVLDREKVVRYVQVLDEITHEPDYEAALDAVRRLG